MKALITEKQLKSLIKKIHKDIEEQDEPVDPEPSSGASDKQKGADGYPETSTWSDTVGSTITRGPDNQIKNTTWADIVGSKTTRGPDNQLK